MKIFTDQRIFKAWRNRKVLSTDNIACVQWFMHGDHPAVEKWLSMYDYQETYRTLVEQSHADIWQVHGHLVNFEEVTPGDWIAGPLATDASTFSKFAVIKESAPHAPPTEALKLKGGAICLKTGLWFSPSFPKKLHDFKAGEKLPHSQGLQVGEVVWYWHPRWNQK